MKENVEVNFPITSHPSFQLVKNPLKHNNADTTQSIATLLLKPISKHQNISFMKKIIYILSVIVLASSCKNIKKMVDQGKYDEAIEYAAKKLHGEEDKKTKYVEALETAYRKVTEQDMAKVKFLAASNHANKYDRMYDLFLKIDRRQNSIKPFLPLISEDGYVAHFKFLRTHEKLNEIADLAAEEHYQSAIAALADFDNYGDKSIARNAYQYLTNIDRYNAKYKDVKELRRVARTKGTNRVAVSVTTGNFVYAGDISQYVLSNFDVERLNSFWTVYDDARNFDEAADYHVIVRVEDIVLGVERERVDHFHEKAIIQVGKKNWVGEDGRVKVDSSGNVLTVPINQEVFATVTDVKREKTAQMYSEIIIKDESRNRVKRNIPVIVDQIFNDYMCTFEGDKRALPANSVKRLDTHLAPFPHDIEMVENMSYQLRDVVYEKIEREMRDIIRA